MVITGTTRIFYCIADPIDQVRAPELFNTVFARHGVDAAMVPLRVSAADLSRTLEGLLASSSVGGIALSIPHKPAAAALVDRCSEAAALANAVNAIRRGADGKWEGDLFDGVGFLQGLDAAGLPYQGRRILIIGAGGAASAVAAALVAAGAKRVGLFDLDRQKARVLAKRLCHEFGEVAVDVPSADPRGYDLIINATPLGLRDGDLLPVDVAAIEPHAAVYDILMKNQPTPLLRAVHARGLVAAPGFDMLIQQMPFYLDFFGYPELAAAVCVEADYLRDLLMPEEMKRMEDAMTPRGKRPIRCMAGANGEPALA
jgi:shikimate dehydrogenase